MLFLWLTLSSVVGFIVVVVLAIGVVDFCVVDVDTSLLVFSLF